MVNVWSEEFETPDLSIEDYEENSKAHSLDLFSTSPTGLVLSPKNCAYHAPYFAYKQKDSAATYHVVQGSCNHWDCPRCGIMVAKGHYGRIVEGLRTIASENELWFITVTCRGKELSEKEAFASYLMWTSKLLDACYTRAKREKTVWHYVQVTEKQKRGFPHSHIITTFVPSDTRDGFVTKWTRSSDGTLVSEQTEALRSDWLSERLLSAGLGEQYDITKVRKIEGASRYVAKYMFKDSQFTTKFPKRWKRVRYSGKFPKLPDKDTGAFVLLSRGDWEKLSGMASLVRTHEEAVFEETKNWLFTSGTMVTLKVRDNGDNSAGL